MLTPEQQLHFTQQQFYAQQQQQQLMLPPRSSYLSEVERQAGKYTTGAIDIGASALAGLPLMGALGSMFLPRRLGSVVSGATGALDPFATGFGAIGKVLSGKLSLAGAGLAVGGAAAAGYTFNKGIDFARENLLEGQRNYVANRELLRELPSVGFGPQSILASPGIAANPANVSNFGRQIFNVGSDFGMSSGQTRNVLSNLGQMGLIDTSSIKAVSSSFRAALRELQSISRQIGGDIQEATRVYKALDQMGFSSRGSRSSILSGMTSASGLTGLGLESVGSLVELGGSYASQAGLNQGFGAISMLRNLGSAAWMSHHGGIDKGYLKRSGGLEGVASRMTQIQVGALQSGTGLGFFSHAFDEYGRLDPKGVKALLRGEAQGFNPRISNMDPYALAGAQEDYMSLHNSFVLAKVGRIRAQHGNDPLRANREQFRFLSSLGISDPTEQQQYLGFLRSAPAGDFAMANQSLHNKTVSLRDGSLRQLEDSSGVISSAIDRIVGNLSKTFQRAGEALQRDMEESNRRLSLALVGHQRQYGSGVGDLDSMRSVSKQVMLGRFIPNSSRPLDLLEASLLRSPYSQSALSESLNVRGVDPQMRSLMLRNPLDHARYQSAKLFDNLMGGVDYTTQSLLAPLLGVPSDSLARMNKPTGALAEGYGVRTRQGVSFGLPVGSMFIGNDLYGNARSTTPGGYLQALARDFGQEIDPSTGRFASLDYRASERLSRAYGTELSGIFNTRFNDPVFGQLRAQENADFNRAGKLWSTLIGAGAGIAIGGLSAGPVGALVGGVAGGALGYFGGELATGGVDPGINLKTLIDAYSQGQGVDTSPILSSKTLKQIGANRELLAQHGAFDETSKLVFGKNYGDLSASQKLVYQELLRRHGGKVGAAIAGDRPDEKMSEFQFSSIVQQEMASKGVESFFGLGMAGELRSKRRAELLSPRIGVEAAIERPSSPLATMLRDSGYQTADFGTGTVNQRFDGGFASLLYEVRELAKSTGFNQGAGLSEADLLTLDGASRTASYDKGHLSSLLRKIQQAGASPDSISKLQTRLDQYFSANSSASGSFKSKVLSDQERSLLQGLDPLSGTLNRSLYNSEGGILPENLSAASGVMRGMMFMADGGDTVSAIKKAKEYGYFNMSQKEASLGLLVEQYAQERGTTPDSAAEELRSQGVLDDADLRMVLRGFGNLSPEGVKSLSARLRGLGDSGRKQLGGLTSEVERSIEGSARSKFLAVRDEQVRARFKLAESKVESRFRLLAEDMGLDLGFAEGADGTFFEQLRGNSRAMGQYTDALQAMHSRIRELRVKGDNRSADQLQSQYDELSSYKGFIEGGSDFVRLSNLATAGGFTNKGGRIALNEGKLLGSLQMAQIDPSALMQSGQYGALSSLLGDKGLSNTETQKALFALVGSKGDSPEARKQVLELFSNLGGGRFQGLEGDKGFATLTDMVKRRSSGDKDVQTAFSNILTQLVQGAFGDGSNPKEREAKQEMFYKQFAELHGKITKASILDSDLKLQIKDTDGTTKDLVAGSAKP